MYYYVLVGKYKALTSHQLTTTPIKKSQTKFLMQQTPFVQVKVQDRNRIGSQYNVSLHKVKLEANFR